MVVIDIKRICSRVLFAMELLVFAWIYFFGAHGFNQLVHLKHEIIEIESEVEKKETDVQEIQQQIITWNVHSFCKEKMAREQLQMARKDELIYLINS